MDERSGGLSSGRPPALHRGEKLGHYKQLPSLIAVLVVSHRRPQVTVVEREGSGGREHRAGKEVVLENPRLSFAVHELYDRIELDEKA